MRRWLKRILWATGIVLLLGIALLFGHPLLRGWQLRERLVTAARHARTITVTEHSDRFDPNVDRDAPYEERIFRTVLLSTEERARLSAAFPASLDYSDVMATMCIFQSHHRIEMVAPDGQVTVLRICFHCQQLDLGDERSRMFPVGWDVSLERFIRSVGMSRLPKEADQPRGQKK